MEKAGSREVIESLIERHAPLRNASEVAWALWAAMQLEITLSAKAAKAVSQMDDDFVALLALDARERGRLPASALKVASWEAMIKDPTVLLEEHWLLAYEATVRGWLSGGQAHVTADSFFNTLMLGDVHFYDKHPPKAPFTGPAAPLPGIPSDEY